MKAKVTIAVTRRKKKPALLQYPPELRGPPNNRYGGHRATGLKTYGGTFGPAGPCRQLSPDERQAIEDQMRKEGRL